MVQIVPRYHFGSEMGKSFGTGLGEGLESIAKLKMQEFQQRQQQKRSLDELLKAEVAPRDAQLLSQFSSKPEAQVKLLEQMMKRDAQGDMKQKESQLQDLLEEAMSDKKSPAEQVDKLALQDDKAELKADDGVSRELGKEEVKLETQESRLSDQISNIGKRIDDPTKSPMQKKQLRDHRDKLEDKLAKRVEQNDKSSSEFFKQTMKEGRTSKQNNKRLDRMETLIDRGNLSIPVYAAGLETLSNGIFGFGIDLTSLTSADSQEFKKLSNDFLREAKGIFGSRLTDADLKAFFKMIPTLSQTGAGKQAVIANMRNFNKGIEIRQGAMQEIIEQNRGIRPANLETLTEKKIDPQLDKLAEEFAFRA